jgi:tetratricopeptide (TPR) repeat protein
LLLLAAALTLAAGCATSGPSTRPNEREWGALMKEHEWLETIRNAAPPPAGASRQQQIAAVLDSQKKSGAAYDAFMEKLRSYYQRTGDPRAARLFANEKILLGDQYMNVLARYDRAINLYQAALTVDPSNAAARQRLEAAQRRRFVAMDVFSTVRTGMKESEVQQLLGLPREDWIKQVVQKNKVYTVWIYPRQDGSAAAIYFENGVVYHTNWNAAPARND